jgi:transketolase
MAQKTKYNTMRDAMIARITEVMRTRRDIFFLSADFGAPALDTLRARFPARFLNVGIAEQNLINVSAGLALEGYTVFAYAIAPFITMRCFEQIRINLSLMSHYRPMNVNLIGVGAGASYDMSGPTHHCFEDLSIMRTLPNIDLVSPCDAVIAREFVDYTLEHRRPKYLRLDSKPLAPMYHQNVKLDLCQGFNRITSGRDIIIIATGNMTHKAKRVGERLAQQGLSAGVIDFFMLRPFNETALVNILKRSRLVLTIEEGFIHKGGLDALVSSVILQNGLKCRVQAFGYRDAYATGNSNREGLARSNSMDDDEIVNFVMSRRCDHR